MLSLIRLVEKLDALHRRVPGEDAAPTTFVGHFEDAARVIHGSALVTTIARLRERARVKAPGEEQSPNDQPAATGASSSSRRQSRISIEAQRPRR